MYRYLPIYGARGLIHFLEEVLIYRFLYHSLYTINIPLTVLIFAFIPFIVYFSMKQKNRMHNAFMETRVETVVNSNLENSLSGIRVTKAFTAQKHEQ